jgi:hypothetical protein
MKSSVAFSQHWLVPLLELRFVLNERLATGEDFFLSKRAAVALQEFVKLRVRELRELQRERDCWPLGARRPGDVAVADTSRFPLRYQSSVTHEHLPSPTVRLVSPK